MLEKKIFEQFIREVDSAYESFRVWAYVNNSCAKNQDYFNDVPLGEDSKFANFWDVSRAALQQSFLLAIARLLDAPYFKGDIEKKHPRLSVQFILEKLEDDRITSDYTKRSKDKMFKKFIYSNRDLRDGKFGHNGFISCINKQKAGIEDFFDIMEWLVKEIKANYEALNSCNNTCYKHADELSKKGVEQIFGNIIKNKKLSYTDSSDWLEYILLADNYHEAAELISKNIAIENNHGLIMPLIYLLKHTIELSLKKSLKFDFSVKSNKLRTHDLKKLKEMFINRTEKIYDNTIWNETVKDRHSSRSISFEAFIDNFKANFNDFLSKSGFIDDRFNQEQRFPSGKYSDNTEEVINAFFNCKDQLIELASKITTDIDILNDFFMRVRRPHHI